MAAVRRRCDLVYEELVQPFVRVVVCEREIQRTLHLSAELPSLPFGLPTG